MTDPKLMEAAEKWRQDNPLTMAGFGHLEVALIYSYARQAYLAGAAAAQMQVKVLETRLEHEAFQCAAALARAQALELALRDAAEHLEWLRDCKPNQHASLVSYREEVRGTCRHARARLAAVLSDTSPAAHDTSPVADAEKEKP